MIANGRWVDGRISALSIEAYHVPIQGGEWEGEMAGDNLLDALKQVSNATGVDFSIELDPLSPGFYIFKTYYPFGYDRSTDGLDPVTGLNGAGLRPVILSTTFSNLASVSYQISHVGEVNVFVALGQGSTYFQDFEVVENTGTITTEISRREGTVSAQNSDLSVADDELLYAATMDLVARKAKRTLRFTPLASSLFHYGRDFDLGDTITVRFYAEDISVRLKSISVSLEGGGAEVIDFAEMEIV